MQEAIKKTSYCLIIIGMTVLTYQGSFRTLVKGRKYIETIGRANSIKTVQQFEENLRDVLDYPAPVSDDEIVKFIGGDVINLVAKPGQSEEIGRELIRFVESYSDQKDVLHILNLGRAYHYLWVNHKNPEDYKSAEKYYEKILVIAPKLPPVLYGMIDLYRVAGDREKTKEYAEKTLMYWPKDARLIDILEKIKNGQPLL